jgi:hypothetical protein
MAIEAPQRFPRLEVALTPILSSRESSPRWILLHTPLTLVPFSLSRGERGRKTCPGARRERGNNVARDIT